MRTLPQKEKDIIHSAMEAGWTIVYSDEHEDFVVVMPTLDFDEDTQSWVMKEDD